MDYRSVANPFGWTTEEIREIIGKDPKSAVGWEGAIECNRQIDSGERMELGVERIKQLMDEVVGGGVITIPPIDKIASPVFTWRITYDRKVERETLDLTMMGSAK